MDQTRRPALGWKERAFNEVERRPMTKAQVVENLRRSLRELAAAHPLFGGRMDLLDIRSLVITPNFPGIFPCPHVTQVRSPCSSTRGNEMKGWIQAHQELQQPVPLVAIGHSIVQFPERRTGIQRTRLAHDSNLNGRHCPCGLKRDDRRIKEGGVELFRVGKLPWKRG